MIQTRVNRADISWEEFPILAFNPDLNVIIIALDIVKNGIKASSLLF
jgi:hypothetical protein